MWPGRPLTIKATVALFPGVPKQSPGCAVCSRMAPEQKERWGRFDPTLRGVGLHPSRRGLAIDVVGVLRVVQFPCTTGPLSSQDVLLDIIVD